MSFNKDRQDITAELKAWRAENYLSVARAAKILNLPPATYHSYETGRRNPQRLIAQALLESIKFY